jgi:hypothetical protein
LSGNKALNTIDSIMTIMESTFSASPNQPGSSDAGLATILVHDNPELCLPKLSLSWVLDKQSFIEFNTSKVAT